MRKRATLDWQFAEEPEEWERLTTLPSAPLLRRHLPRRVVWSGLLALLVLLSLGLGWLWQTAQAGLAAIESDIDAAVTADAWSERHETAAVQLLQLEGKTAIVAVELPAAAGMPMLQQTRVYRQTDTGWTRTAPSADLWGEARRLETAHFVFAYHERDEQAVKASAAHLERLYLTLYAAFFTTPLPADKYAIRVDPAQTPGDFVPWRNRQDPLVVASPAAYLAPSDITPEELLSQSIALLLLKDFEDRLAAPYLVYPYRPGYDQYGMTAQLWPLESGVTLWQLWASDLPLAQWREPVVQWVLRTTPLAPDQPYVEPAFQPELCAMHQLWTDLPLYLNLPFVCDARPELRGMMQEWLWSRPRRSDDPLSLTARYIETSDSLYSTRAVALATAIEYAAATYGAERIPALLAALDRHGRWDTLVTEVFGVSAQAFETGWADYLDMHYGITEIQ